MLYIAGLPTQLTNCYGIERPIRVCLQSFREDIWPFDTENCGNIFLIGKFDYLTTASSFKFAITASKQVCRYWEYERANSPRGMSP